MVDLRQDRRLSTVALREEMVFEKNYVNQTTSSSCICSAVILGKINRSKEGSDHSSNLVFTAGGFIKELNCALLRTLKVISYRATHFLSFLIIIMVINVYKLRILLQMKEVPKRRLRSRNSVPFCLMPGVMMLYHPPLPAGLSPSPSLLRASSLLTPQGTAGT